MEVGVFIQQERTYLLPQSLTANWELSGARQEQGGRGVMRQHSIALPSSRVGGHLVRWDVGQMCEDGMVPESPALPYVHAKRSQQIASVSVERVGRSFLPKLHRRDGGSRCQSLNSRSTTYAAQQSGL